MVNKHSTEEISFIIPIKIDSNDRLENINFTCKYLKKSYINSQIILVECDINSNLNIFANKLKIDYFFLKKERFSKSLAVNLGLINSNKNFICIWDADMIASPDAIIQGLNILKKNQINLIVPHNQIFVNIKNNLRERFLLDCQSLITELHSISKYNYRISNENMDIYTCHGGFILTRKDTLKSIGGFNFLMTSYGWEDSEILLRYKKLGLNYCFIKEFSTIHLHHYRGEDSKINEFYNLNFLEYKNVESMNYLNLYKYSTSFLRSNYDKNYKNDLIKLNLSLRIFKLFIFYRYLLNYHLNVFGIIHFSKYFFKRLFLFTNFLIKFLI